jgi:hypothetical protein
MLILLTVVMCSCGAENNLITKKDAFPRMYDEHPVSILVLPPINASTSALAKEYYTTTLAEPISQAGYYVFPLEVVNELLKSEGLYDTETMLKVPPQKFKEYFGADSVMYVKILKWDTSYYVIGGDITVSVDFLLKSTKTGETLWSYDGTIVLNTTGGNYASAGLAGIVIQIVETAVKTAMADYQPLAKQANFQTVSTMPHGKYNDLYLKDFEEQVWKKQTDSSIEQK